jgi:DNA-directed RNA polymerase subunit N (RpoN/RPB10)
MPSGPRIIRNAIRCVKCGDVIESTHVHDFRYCKCGTVAVDGGREYLRRINLGAYEDLSITEDMQPEVKKTRAELLGEIRQKLTK